MMCVCVCVCEGVSGRWLTRGMLSDVCVCVCVCVCVSVCVRV